MKKWAVIGGDDQEGFAAIVIAIIMVLVLSLTTVGFAQLMQREQRNALDKQLSSQAYYAAETGVNDAAKAINSGYNVAKTTCGPLSTTDTTPGATWLAGPTANVVNDNTDASYTCLLINPTPSSLEYNLNDTSQPRYAELTGVNSAATTQIKQIASLVVSWEDSANNTSFVPNTSYNFTTASNWTYAGMLKVALTPLTSNGIDRAKLIRESYTAFLFPNRSANAGVLNNYSYANSVGKDGGAILNGNCHTGNSSGNTPRDCNVRITDLGSASLLLILTPIYRGSNVTITAYGTDGTKLSIANAQTLVDSTGKAHDVLRRIQVRIPTQNSYDVPNGTSAQQALCKQVQLTDTNATSGSPSDCPIP